MTNCADQASRPDVSHRQNPTSPFANPHQSRYRRLSQATGRGRGTCSGGSIRCWTQTCFTPCAGWGMATRSRSSTPTTPPSRPRYRPSPARRCLMAGVSAARAVEAILSVMPLDTFVPDPAGRMEVVGDPNADPPVQREVQAVLDRAAGKHVPLQGIERFDFYERAKKRFRHPRHRRTPLLRRLHLQERRRPAGVKTPLPIGRSAERPSLDGLWDSAGVRGRPSLALEPVTDCASLRQLGLRDR